MGNVNFPVVHHNPRVFNPSASDEPAPWLTALKDSVVEKVHNHRSSRSNASTKTATNDDAASTYSAASSATTLKGTEDPSDKKKKWYSMNSKPETTQEKAQKRSHNQAVVDYLALR